MADFTIDQNAEILIKKLIGSQDESIDYDAITNEMLTGTGVALEDFWQQFIGFLQNEYEELGNHIPILESDFNGRDAHKTLFDFINENCDLSDDLIEQLKQKFQENGIDLSEQSGMNNSKDYFWNESMSKALALFLKEFDPTTYNEDESAYTGAAAAIKNADAAYSFDEDWVKPTEIDGNSYEDVRGVDAIESVLKNSSQMQFTRDKSSPWLRLIMPKYLRKVEVEDLNRNFWVISATLGAICDFLFGADAPFKDLFEDIISELVQLWENVLYLWATIAALSHKEPITEVHTEVIPISNSEIENYIKFDYFQVGKDAEDWEPDGMKSFLISQCKYLVDSYEKCHLCLLPYLRINNYKHNYYSEELYPGILFYNRNTNNWTFLAIKNAQDDKYTVRIDAQEIIDDPILGGLTATIKENEFTYEFLYGAKKAELQNEPFYLLLRTDQTFSAHYEENSDIIVVDSFTVRAKDISFTLRNNHELIVKQFYKDDEDTWDSSEDGYVEVIAPSSDDVKNSVIQAEALDPDFYYDHEHPDDIEIFNISKGFYRGEFPSYLVPLSAQGLRLDTEGVLMAPFIADNWDEIVAYLQGKADAPQSLREYDRIDENENDKARFRELESQVDQNNLVHSKNNDSRILDLYAKTQTQPNTLCLYRNNHQITFITIDNNLIKQPYDSSSSNDWYELKMSSPELELTDGFKKVEDPQNGNSYYVLNKVNNITYHDIEVFNETHEETDWPGDKESYYYIDANNNYIKVSENDEFDVNKVYYKSVQKETETTMPCIIGLDSYLYNYSNVATLYNAYTKSFTTYSKYEFYGYGQGWGTPAYSIIPGESPFNQEVYLYIPKEDRVLTKENWVLVIVDNQYSELKSEEAIKAELDDKFEQEAQEAWDNIYSSLYDQAIKCSDNPDKARSMSTKVYFRHTFHIFKADGKYCSMTYDRGWRGVQNKKDDGNPCYNSEYPLNYWSKTYINDGQFNYEDFIQTIENDYKLLSKSGENILDYQHYPNTGFEDKEEVAGEPHIIDFNSTGD